MESKRVWQCARGVRFSLLIEPVWNRNIAVSLCANRFATLLIEPVWNRNKQSSNTSASWSLGLLIEPVWNRNPKQTAQTEKAKRLLIEPVWNRNWGDKGRQMKERIF